MQLIHETIDLRALSRVSGFQTSTLNDCVVTKQTFCKFFFSTVGNEDDRCQSQRIGKLIEQKLLKGNFKVD